MEIKHFFKKMISKGVQNVLSMRNVNGAAP